MKRAIFLCAILAASAAFAGAQQSSKSNPYEGVSAPPPNDTIVDEAPPQPTPPPDTHAAKPSPDHYAAPKSAQPARTTTRETAPANRVPPDFITSANGDGTDAGIVEPRSAMPASYITGANGEGTDAGIVQPRPALPANNSTVTPTVTARLYASDPDGDIVHPQPLPPGELGDGTIIRVRLLNDLASGINQPGDIFRSAVIQNVFEDGTLLIPAGSQINGTVVRVSTGDGLGGGGSMDIRPDTVILPDGTHYHLYAMVSGTPDSHTRVGPEGTITPTVRLKKDSMEYGGGIGAGAVTGAVLGGPVGALAGSIVGAAAITAHLIFSHPQAKIDSGSKLEFTLTEPLRLVPATTKTKGD
jgi:type IV secretory pathway VirB10-like protein